MDVQVAMRSKTTRGHKPTQIVAEGESKNEALTEEVQRGGHRKKRSDKATAAVAESEPAASAASEPREKLQLNQTRIQK